MARELVTALAPSAVRRDALLEPDRCGKSVIKRAAIIVGSRGAAKPFGGAAINDANLSVAIFPGDRANSAASCQGSISSLANIERTLSGMALLSSPTDANRNSSNSDRGRKTEAAWVIFKHQLLTLLLHAQR